MFVVQAEASSSVDSCITHESLDRAADHGYCTADTTGHVVEVKQELLQDVIMEDAHENEMEYGDISVKVRVCALHFLMFFTHAV